MRILLDTHAFLWFVMGDARTSATARAIIEDERNERLISLGSLWEIAIKTSIRKLHLMEPFDVLIPRQLHQNGFQLLAIALPHVTAVSTLPFHHRDPFDRLLVAQSLTEQIPLLSADSVFDAYSIQRLW
jgi:PIN domain nuclease of toxin-antitoxin system